MISTVTSVAPLSSVTMVDAPLPMFAMLGWLVRPVDVWWWGAAAQTCNGRARHSWDSRQAGRASHTSNRALANYVAMLQVCDY